MKIVHVMAGDLSGGAARGTYWLHRALLRLGVDSQVLINAPHDQPDDSLININTSAGHRVWQGISNRLSELPRRLQRPDNQHQQFDNGLGGSLYKRNPAFRRADLVHLHHVNGAVSVRSLRTIDKPMIWTLRSMWPMTGGCHYSFDCQKYRSGCSGCPQLGTRFPFDLAQRNTRIKRSSYPAHLEIVGVSDWISDCARASTLLGGYSIQTIHNGIDTADFYPVDQQVAKTGLKLRADTRYLLVVAQNFQNRHKGFAALCQALNHVNPTGLHLIVVGNTSREQLSELRFPHTWLGRVTDTDALRAIYSASSVFIAPNLMETFGKTIVEAMACGTPVVCFDSTGPRELVEHEVSGYCAESFDPEALARGIDWMLGLSAAAGRELSANARKRATEHFDTLISGRKYLDLYRRVLERNDQASTGLQNDTAL